MCWVGQGGGGPVTGVEPFERTDVKERKERRGRHVTVACSPPDHPSPTTEAQHHGIKQLLEFYPANIAEKSSQSKSKQSGIPAWESVSL